MSGTSCTLQTVEHCLPSVPWASSSFHAPPPTPYSKPFPRPCSLASVQPHGHMQPLPQSTSCNGHLLTVEAVDNIITPTSYWSPLWPDTLLEGGLPGKTVSPGSGAVQASHLKCSLGSDGCPIPARLTAAILNSYNEPSVKPSTCMDFVSINKRAQCGANTQRAKEDP